MIEIKELINLSLDIDRIAHTCSQLCRWRGRFKWVSLGEHLCVCADLLNDESEEAQRLGLIHDVVEAASFNDVISPLKNDICVYHDHKMNTLRGFESEFTFSYYNVLWKSEITYERYVDIKPIIKEVDVMSRLLEMEYFGFDESDDMNEALGSTSVRIEGWSSERAKQEFLSRYERLR